MVATSVTLNGRRIELPDGVGSISIMDGELDDVVSALQAAQAQAQLAALDGSAG